MINLIENANNWLILGTILIIIELFFIVFLPHLIVVTLIIITLVKLSVLGSHLPLGLCGQQDTEPSAPFQA